MNEISVFHFVILCLGVYRLTGVIVDDVVLNRARLWLWKKFPPENEGIGYIFTCTACASIWASTLLILLYTISNSTALVVGSILAASAVVRLLTALVDR